MATVLSEGVLYRNGHNDHFGLNDLEYCKLIFSIRESKMNQNGPFWPKEVYFGPFRSANLEEIIGSQSDVNYFIALALGTPLIPTPSIYVMICCMSAPLGSADFSAIERLAIDMNSKHACMLRETRRCNRPSMKRPLLASKPFSDPVAVVKTVLLANGLILSG